MKTLKDIVTDLRQRRLWPVALVLVLALVAVPVLLSKKASSTPVAQLPATGAPTSLSTSGPAVTVEGTPNQTHLKGKARNPFTPQGSTTKQSSGAASATLVASGAGSTGSYRGLDRRRVHRLDRHRVDRHDRLDRWRWQRRRRLDRDSASAHHSPGTSPVTTPPVTGVPTGKSQPAPAGLQADRDLSRIAVHHQLQGRPEQDRPGRAPHGAPVQERPAARRARRPQGRRPRPVRGAARHGGSAAPASARPARSTARCCRSASTRSRASPCRRPPA